MKARRIWASAIVASLALAGVVVTGVTRTAAGQPKVIVYKTKACGCCGKWVSYLRAENLRVSVRTKSDLNGIKQRYSIPVPLMSCHTAVVEGYALEGHVPADVIERLLRERPAITGLAVPGMPAAAPGMDSPYYRDPYSVVAFDREGGTRVYATR